MLAMIHCTFHSLGKQLKKLNSNELKRIIRRLDYVDMMEVEMETNDDAALALKTKLNETGVLVSSDFTFSENVNEINAILIEK